LNFTSQNWPNNTEIEMYSLRSRSNVGVCHRVLMFVCVCVYLCVCVCVCACVLCCGFCTECVVVVDNFCLRVFVYVCVYVSVCGCVFGGGCICGLLCER